MIEFTEQDLELYLEINGHIPIELLTTLGRGNNSSEELPPPEAQFEGLHGLRVVKEVYNDLYLTNKSSLEYFLRKYDFTYLLKFIPDIVIDFLYDEVDEFGSIPNPHLVKDSWDKLAVILKYGGGNVWSKQPWEDEWCPTEEVTGLYYSIFPNVDNPHIGEPDMFYGNYDAHKSFYSFLVVEMMAHSLDRFYEEQEEEN